MNNIYKLVVGDWSGDGHDKTISYYFKSFVELSAIEFIYKRNAEFIGFDIFDYCNEYEDNLIPKEKLDLLSDYMNLRNIDKDGEENYCIFPSDFKDIFLTIVNSNEPLIEEIQIPEFSLHGGYGLFAI